ncbi:DNA -binding domain-containing protein [Luteimonas saliphila]|uniref:DNA -binding domain-containing protein n=1 Tax=Luteimonas saliphila TaxID=2804919 RepID=UPI00192DCF43
MPDDDPAAERFDLWAIPGGKALTVDGADLRLHVRAGSELVGLVLSETLHDGDRFACAVPVSAKVQPARAMLDLAFGLLRRPRVGTRTSVSRPSRSAVVYARALQALDGALAGASQREIAIAVFGEARVTADWTADSELRAQVRYLIQRGRVLMEGQYRTLLD